MGNHDGAGIGRSGRWWWTALASQALVAVAITGCDDVEPDEDDDDEVGMRYGSGAGSGSGSSSGSGSTSTSSTSTSSTSTSSTGEGTGSGTGSGSGSSSASGDTLCCICEYQPIALGGQPGHEQLCNDWIANHEPPCDESKVRAIHPQALNPTCPPAEDCDNASYQYFGHGNAALGDDFIDHVVEMCIECGNVDATLSGCSFFDDVTGMQNYLNSLELPCGATLSLQASQCDVPVGSEECLPGSCKLTYGCEAPAYAPCSQSLGVACSTPGDTITCMQDAEGGPTCSYEGQLSCCAGNPDATWQQSC